MGKTYYPTETTEICPSCKIALYWGWSVGGGLAPRRSRDLHCLRCGTHYPLPSNPQ